MSYEEAKDEGVRRSHERWGRIRLRGRRRYLLVQGVLLGGGLFTAGIVFGYSHAGRLQPKTVLHWAVVTVVYGYASSLDCWKRNEKAYLARGDELID